MCSMILKQKEEKENLPALSKQCTNNLHTHEKYILENIQTQLSIMYFMLAFFQRPLLIHISKDAFRHT